MGWGSRSMDVLTRSQGCPWRRQGWALRAEMHALSSFYFGIKKGEMLCIFAHFLALPLGSYIAIRFWTPGALGPTTAPGLHGPWAPRAPSVQRSGMRFFLECEGSAAWCILGWSWGDGSGSTDVLTGPLRAKDPEKHIIGWACHAFLPAM